MSNNANIRQQITDQLIAAIEKGTLPWRRQFTPDSASGLATSLSSGKRYNGINQILLQMSGHRNGYRSKYWGTYKAIQFAGSGPGHVRRGEKATKIFLANPIKKTKKDKNGQEKTETFLIFKQFAVYNAEQCEGLDEYQVGYACSNVSLTDGCEEADKIIEATGAKIEYCGNQPAYHPTLDKIFLPNRHQFESSEAFYETAFHELGHWAHHPSRMNPPQRSKDEAYAFNELVAEMSACYLMAECNLSLNENNHAAYLKSWVSALKNDTRFIFQASALASRTSDYILDFSRTKSVAIEDQEVVPF